MNLTTEHLNLLTEKLNHGTVKPTHRLTPARVRVFLDNHFCRDFSKKRTITSMAKKLKVSPKRALRMRHSLIEWGYDEPIDYDALRKYEEDCKRQIKFSDATANLFAVAQNVIINKESDICYAS